MSGTAIHHKKVPERFFSVSVTFSKIFTLINCKKIYANSYFTELYIEVYHG